MNWTQDDAGDVWQVCQEHCCERARDQYDDGEVDDTVAEEELVDSTGIELFAQLVRGESNADDVDDSSADGGDDLEFGRVIDVADEQAMR